MKSKLLIVATIFTLISCSEMTSALKLQQAISKKYSCSNISVSINNNENIKVTITNCDCCKKSKYEQQLIADSIGMMAQHIIGREIKSGEATFESKNNYLVASYSTSNTFDMHIGVKDTITSIR
jgi:hypothetical protein